MKYLVQSGIIIIEQTCFCARDQTRPGLIGTEQVV